MGRRSYPLRSSETTPHTMEHSGRPMESAFPVLGYWPMATTTSATIPSWRSTEVTSDVVETSRGMPGVASHAMGDAPTTFRLMAVACLLRRHLRLMVNPLRCCFSSLHKMSVNSPWPSSSVDESNVISIKGLGPEPWPLLGAPNVRGEILRLGGGMHPPRFLDEGA
jgi:hypothetical protein